MDEHHGNATTPERLRERDARGQLRAQEITQEESPAFPAPLRRLAERPGERGGRLDLEPHLAAVDVDATPIESAVDLERAVQHRLRQLAARVVDAQQRGHRGPEVRPEEARAIVRSAFDCSRRQRRADSRSPVSCPETAHPELGHGHELDQVSARPSQRVRLEMHRDLLAERQGVEAGAQVDHRAVSGRERLREPAIVEVGGDAESRVELVRGLAPGARKQERPGADRRFEIEVPLACVVAVLE